MERDFDQALHQSVIGQKHEQYPQNSSSKSNRKQSSIKSFKGKLTQSGEIEEIDGCSQARIYYNMIFSSNQTAKSLQLRNQAFEAQQLNQQILDNDNGVGVYWRRKKRLEYLYHKESQQIKALNQLKDIDPDKFQAIIQLLKFFSKLKQKVKVDYYSHKTFCAIKSSSAKEITKLSKVLQKILKEAKEGYEEVQQTNQNLSTEKDGSLIRQFLIIPRFLISRQKIQQFNRSQETQDSFRFLVQNLCLGHQNNQANKKMPDRDLIKLLSELLNRQNGKQIFKTICSINHGNKYKLENGNAAYAQLFTYELQQLRQIDRSHKKSGKKSECNFNSTIKSKSNIGFDIESDQDFLPMSPVKNKSKLKSRFSLNYETESPQKSKEAKGNKFRLKQSKSLHVDFDQFNIKSQMDIQPLSIINEPFKKKQSPFWMNQDKILSNIIIIFPPRSSDEQSYVFSSEQKHQK